MSKQKVSGVILLDKPEGMTSQQVVSRVKHLFKSAEYDSKKAGHTGTLDPMATGLLPICLGEATKFSHYQLDADKGYHAIIELGQKTDTGDAQGQVIASQALPENHAQDKTVLAEVCQQFLGQQLQVPPMYSALKKNGKKLYEYAREGVEVKRTPRPILIQQLSLHWLSANCLQLQVVCSKGTYVRVLGEDIAKALGTLGHLVALRRVVVGDFDVAQAVSLSELEAMSLPQRFERLLPVDECIKKLPSMVLDDMQCQRIVYGQRLNVYPQLKQQFDDGLLVNLQKQQLIEVRLLANDGTFLGLAEIDVTGRLQPKKLVSCD